MSTKSNGKKIDQDKRSNKSHMGSELNRKSDLKFDEGKIIDHYIKQREFQQQKLANINMSQELKRKLFGFSQASYLNNNHDPYKLVVENHPMRGRGIMSEQRFKNDLLQKQREREFKSCFSMNSQSRLHIDSDIDLPFPQEPSSKDLSNPEFNRLQELKQEHF